MKKVTRRDFINRSLIYAGSAALLIPKKSWAGAASPLVSRQDSREYPSYLELEKKGILSRRIEELFSFYENCTLCPRDCRVNRIKGQTGKCQATARVKVSSAFPHFGEERPLVGTKGSGTVFFSNCGLRCIFCQNYTISIQGEGIEISDNQLADSMLRLQRMGCHNINLVTPTHYVPNIVRALQVAIGYGLRIPLVYNTGGYEMKEVLELLDGIIDIYLPDGKYSDPIQAARFSDEAYNYPHYNRIALKEIHRQVGDLVLDGRGIAIRGLILRHLVLPNRVAGTEDFLKFVSEQLSRTTYLNLMGQYRPEHKASEYKEISRRIKRNELQEAAEWAKKYGLTRLAR